MRQSTVPDDDHQQQQRAVLLQQAVWKRRSDLRVDWIDGRTSSEGYWVVRDPLARDWFCLTAVEKSLLDLVDGRHSLAELCRLAVERLHPLEISVDGLIAFYARARRSGLLVTIGRGGPIDGSPRQPHPRGSAIAWIGKLLFFRLPGFNPNLFFRLPNWIQRTAQSRLAMFAYFTVLFLALVIVIGRLDEVLVELSACVARTDLWFWLLVLVTIAAAKTVHEAAHVVACRFVGAECREVGLMLLIGTPCLYCDVSDLWAVASRSKRILVSAAGILAELFLAGVAAIVWSLTYPSTLHQLALVVMTVCSISTVMVNANPLLRYDGYFILSDWLGAPNLSQRATATLGNLIGRLVDGHSTPQTPDAPIGRPLSPTLLVIYALSSGLYRVFVMVLIFLLIYRGATDFGIGVLGIALGGLLLGSMLWRFSSQISSRSKRSDRSTAGWRRRAVVGSAVLMTAVIVFAMPLPRSVVVPVLVVATDEQAIQSTESGTVVHWNPSEPFVGSGQVLLQLSNHELEDRLHATTAELAVATRIVDVLQTRRGTGTSSSAAIAIAIKRQQAAHKSHALTLNRFERLAIQAPAAGRFYARSSQSTEWYNSPLRPGQWLPAGTPIGWIGHPSRRAGTALVAEDQIDLIRVGQVAQISHSSIRSGPLAAVIQHVSSIAVSTIPDELQAVMKSPDLLTPRSMYQVQVRVAETAAGDVLPLRSVVWAEISVESSSLWNRLQRWVAAEYRGL